MGLLVFIATVPLCLILSSASPSEFNQGPKKDGSLSFLVIGDWGRKGTHNQTKVAVQVNYMSIIKYVCGSYIYNI
ncbi:putative Acid phosphatase [Lupinus albus]|uniref:Putative Acid phosphatase n=1 Tax=Lupinus albus TaxID=3870 RepID=A0A6A4PHV6_LUPAL|nr:putative Acid phosphatase [Lupinus albus]